MAPSGKRMAQINLKETRHCYITTQGNLLRHPWLLHNLRLVYLVDYCLCWELIRSLPFSYCKRWKHDYAWKKQSSKVIFRSINSTVTLKASQIIIPLLYSQGHLCPKTKSNSDYFSISVVSWRKFQFFAICLDFHAIHIVYFFLTKKKNISTVWCLKHCFIRVFINTSSNHFFPQESWNFKIDIDELGHKGMTTLGRYCLNQELK